MCKKLLSKRQLVLIAVFPALTHIIAALPAIYYLNEVLSVNLSTRCQGADDMTGDEMIITVLLW